MTELVLAGLAAASVWAALRPGRLDRRVAERLRALIGERERPPGGGAGPRALLERIGALIPGDRTNLSRALAAGGVGMPAGVVAGGRVVAGGAGLALGLLVARRGGPALLLAPALAWACCRVPDVLVESRVRARREEVADELPEVAELVALCLEAGLSLPLALSRAAAPTPGVLGHELRQALREIELGVPRRQALAGWAARCGGEEAEAMVAALTAAERFGTQAAASLESFARDLRLRRRRRAEEQARRAPVKLLFPLILLILPAFILLTIVPFLLGTLRGLGL